VRGLASLLGEEAHAQAADGRQRRLGPAGQRGHEKAHDQHDELDQFLASHNERTI
jgi:hypothetical protein